MSQGVGTHLAERMDQMSNKEWSVLAMERVTTSSSARMKKEGQSKIKTISGRPSSIGCDRKYV